MRQRSQAVTQAMSSIELRKNPNNNYQMDDLTDGGGS